MVCFFEILSGYYVGIDYGLDGEDLFLVMDFVGWEWMFDLFGYKLVVDFEFGWKY